MQKDIQRAPASVHLDEENYVKSVADKVQSLADVGQKLEYLLVTGNLQSRSGLDLSQASGFTIVAERLNFFRHAACPLPCAPVVSTASVVPCTRGAWSLQQMLFMYFLTSAPHICHPRHVALHLLPSTSQPAQPAWFGIRRIHGKQDIDEASRSSIRQHTIA